MSEETKNIGSTYKMQCEYDIYIYIFFICHRYISVGHTYRYCGRILQGASKQVQEQTLKNVFQNFDLPTKTALKTKKGLSCGNKHGISQESQDHGKAKEVLKSAKKKGYSIILAR